MLEQRDTQVLTGDPRGGMHRWDSRQTGVSVDGPYGLQYTDPAPIATHVISADALEGRIYMYIVHVLGDTFFMFNFYIFIASHILKTTTRFE